MSLKKLFVGVSTTAVILTSMAVPAFAGNSGDGSEYGTQYGFEVSSQQTICYGHGAFGYFGKDNNLGIKSDPTDPGANGTQTGINNSQLCGNRQVNP
jgi:hypothetical protein